jgi:methylmalonyl-CoA mutase N-terminal domain/subunit
MDIDEFAPNLSFFFSNGMDPEYSVIGRVARRIWAKAMKNKYKGNDRSQKVEISYTNFWSQFDTRRKLISMISDYFTGVVRYL